MCNLYAKDFEFYMKSFGIGFQIASRVCAFFFVCIYLSASNVFKYIMQIDRDLDVHDIFGRPNPTLKSRAPPFAYFGHLAYLMQTYAHTQALDAYDAGITQQ